MGHALAAENNDDQELAIDLTTCRPSKAWKRDPATVVLLADGGVVLTRADYERKLRVWHTALHGENGIAAVHPQRHGESAQAWVDRIVTEDPRAFDAFWNCAHARANLERLDREERDRKQSESDTATGQARKKLEVDHDHVAELVAIVDGAAEKEALLAGIWSALEKHNSAERARRQLKRIRRDAAKGAAELGVQPPDIPALLDAPKDAVQLVRTLQAGGRGNLFGDGR